MQPIIYNSLDAGAPQLSVTAGGLNTVIKACLVTGYGNKPAAGWDIAFEDMATKKLAIRSTNAQSLKSVLLLDNTSTSSASVTAYADWDDASETGVNQFGAGYFVSKWLDNNPSWVVLATDKFFYLFVRSEATSVNMRVLSAFGDAKLLDPSKEGCVVLLASQSTGYGPTSTEHKTVATSTGVNAAFPSSLFTKIDSSFGWGDRSNGYKSNIVMLSRFALYQSNSPALELPGMLMPYAEITGYTLGSDNIDRLTNQVPFLNPVLGMYQPYHGRVWIHTDDWG